ncbi:MAG: 1-aminocyclopropane-1-carboxylate deaminase [Marivirga sp.]|nr:1-aminocyclopropane-1-carboxylate deaminase [Marivirga sp.]
MLSYKPTPTVEIFDRLLRDASVRLFIRREDLNHPFVSGNKWWKLKYNLEEALRQGQKRVLTFGGAFSNHIYSTAAAANELKMKSIGIIRGEERLPLNPVLHFAEANGMKLHYTSRETYRSKMENTFINKLNDVYGDFYLIPEGGSNALAVKGVEEFANTLDIEHDYLCCPVGTGGTLAGLIRGAKGRKKILGFSALKNGSFLQNEIMNLGSTYDGWGLITDYHFGGYAKSTKELLAFIDDFKRLHGIPLEFIYSGKMIYGIFDLVQKGFFEKGSRLLAIHTGGIH